LAIDDGSRPLAELLAQPAGNSDDTLERIP
jgi:hypothetical protein